MIAWKTIAETRYIGHRHKSPLPIYCRRELQVKLTVRFRAFDTFCNCVRRVRKRKASSVKQKVDAVIIARYENLIFTKGGAYSYAKYRRDKPRTLPSVVGLDATTINRSKEYK